MHFSKGFQKQILIILVNSKNTKDQPVAISKFFKKRSAYYHFPCLVTDTILTKLFPHQSVPHCIIIANGKVKAITGEEGSTGKISSAWLISGTDVAFSPKQDEQRLFRFATGKPGAAVQKAICGSTLTGIRPALPSLYGLAGLNHGKFSRLFAYNQSPEPLSPGLSRVWRRC